MKATDLTHPLIAWSTDTFIYEALIVSSWNFFDEFKVSSPINFQGVLNTHWYASKIDWPVLNHQHTNVLMSIARDSFVGDSYHLQHKFRGNASLLPYFCIFYCVIIPSNFDYETNQLHNHNAFFHSYSSVDLCKEWLHQKY